MSRWQPWNQSERRPPVPPDQLVDVLYDGDCVFDTVRADHAEWFGARRSLIMWRAHVPADTGTAPTRSIRP